MSSSQRPVVVVSIETDDGLRCVDICEAPGDRYTWAEYRRDSEDPHGWRPTGVSSAQVFETPEAALANAGGSVGWLASAVGSGPMSLA